MSATEPLQAVLDAQAEQIIQLQTAFAAIAAAVPKPVKRGIARASELGCKTNDPTFDNFPLLQPVLDRAAGIEFDLAGLYYLSAPLRTKPGAASPLLGNSASWRFDAECRTGLAAMSANVTHLVEVTGVDSQGSGLVQVVRDLYFLGSPTCDGLRIHGGSVVSVDACSFRNCKKGVWIQPTPRLYAPRLSCSMFSGCGTGIHLENGTSVCCFTADACVINGGGNGVFIENWQRGAAFTGVAIEGQTDRCFWIRGGRASLRACYFESAETVPGLEVKSSRLTIEDSSIHRFKKDSASEIEWRGQNAQGGTLDYGA